MPWKNKVAQKAYARAYYLKTKNDPNRKASVMKSLRKWQKKNRLRLNKYKREHYNPERQKRNFDKYREAYNAKKRDECKNLTEGYMIQHLKKLGWTLEQIKEHPEIIETTRIIIKTKRLWKQLTTSGS